jgi:hypothetical protein
MIPKMSQAMRYFMDKELPWLLEPDLRMEGYALSDDLKSLEVCVMSSLYDRHYGHRLQVDLHFWEAHDGLRLRNEHGQYVPIDRVVIRSVVIAKLAYRLLGGRD